MLFGLLAMAIGVMCHSDPAADMRAMQEVQLSCGLILLPPVYSQTPIP